MCCVAQEMFAEASAFNQPVNSWDVGQVSNMKVRRCLRSDIGAVTACHGSVTRACWCRAQSMFYKSSAFNQPVNAWNVGKVTDIQVCRRLSGNEWHQHDRRDYAYSWAVGAHCVRVRWRRKCFTK